MDVVVGNKFYFYRVRVLVIVIVNDCICYEIDEKGEIIFKF